MTGTEPPGFSPAACSAALQVPNREITSATQRAYDHNPAAGILREQDGCPEGAIVWAGLRVVRALGWRSLAVGFCLWVLGSSGSLVGHDIHLGWVGEMRLVV